MAKSISASVGQGGVNRAADVKTIQELLNQIPVSKGGPAPPLAVDGLVGTKTIGAIRNLQKFHFGWSDGRVDTNNVTIAKLNELTAKAPPKPPGPPFRFEESKPNNGFDGKVSPPWQMVPASGSKIVKVVNAAGLTFSSNKPSVATVTQISPTEIRIGGLAKQTAVIEAKDASGKVVGTLDVAVKSKKTVVASYFYVEDSAKPQHKTSRNVGDEVGLTKQINDIFLPQANIEFSVKTAKPLPIAKDLGKVVRWAKNITGVPKSEDEWDLLRSKRDGGADLNVFFVWEYEQDASPDDDDTAAGTIRSDKMTIMEDKFNGLTADEVLAHEAGHFLGFSGHSADQDDLMTDKGKSKLKLPKDHVNLMNP